jgi:cytochrome b
MKHTKILVWDLPVRLFHILLVIGFTASYIIAKYLGEDAPTFPYHAMLGLTLVVLVILRLIWAVSGTRWARLTALKLNPADLIAHFKSIVTRKDDTPTNHTGHNPATSLTMLLMFAMICWIGWTGYQSANGNRAMKGPHELAVNGVLVLIAVHVVGVIIHTLQHGTGMLTAMINGKKSGDPADAIPTAAPVTAMAIVLITGFFLGSLVASFNPSTGETKWPITGKPLVLGESEENEGAPIGELEREDD